MPPGTGMVSCHNFYLKLFICFLLLSVCIPGFYYSLILTLNPLQQVPGTARPGSRAGEMGGGTYCILNSLLIVHYTILQIMYFDHVKIRKLYTSYGLVNS